MLLLCRTFIAFLIAGVAVLPSPGAELKLPPITGELSGKFAATELSGAPEILWKIKIVPDGSGQRQVEADLSADGARLRLRAELDETTSNGTWEIVESELDAAAWLAMLSPHVGERASNVTASGKLHVSGSGAIKDRRPSGVVHVVWSDGALRNAVDGWALEGITLKGDLAIDVMDLATMTSSSPWELAIQTISSPRFGARNLSVTAKFNANRTVSLLSARVEIAGGEMTVDPSTVSIFPPVLDFTVRIDRVGLQDLVALVPGSLSDARGRIDGVVRLGWSQAAGLQIGAGKFDLRDDEIATLRLAAAPGFLTQRVPERLVLLPAWTGRVGQWLATPNPVYGDVREIELGHTELQIVSFGLTLTPQGDERARTGVVEVSARPTTPGGAVKLLKFDLNIFGSVSDLLRWGMVDQVSFNLR